MDCREKILSNHYRDVITDFTVRYSTLGDRDLCYVNIDDQYSIIYVNETGIPPLMENIYEYSNTPKLYGLMQTEQRRPAGEPFDINSLLASGIVQVQREPLGLTGRGTIVCIIDTGIDYTMDVFRDETGSSRILAIWDQTIQEGQPPENFLYGTEYTREDINRALQAENPYSVVPSRDESGHGTSMASVAAGSRLGGGREFLGAAPEADILIVKLKEAKQYLRDYYMIPEGVPAYAEQDIMLAVQYADSYTAELNRPVIICLGVGTNMGDHNGNSALSRYLNSIALKRSRAVIAGGGNEGNAAHHYSGVLSMGSTSDSYEDVEIRVGENNRGFILEFWGNIPDAYSIAIRSPGGETIPPVRLGLEDTITYGFIYERTKITIGNVLVEPYSGEELQLFRVENPTPGIWNFRVSPARTINNGAFNMWLPITQFLSSEAYFLQSDPYTTLTEPAMANAVIGVSTYNDQNNSFYIESGRGFSRTGRIRPDFAAPGVNVSTIFGKQTGSSLASAITAGAVAQFMQWAAVEGNNYYLESTEVKNYLIRGAVRNPDLEYPNREWGYGRLNIAGTFDALINL